MWLRRKNEISIINLECFERITIVDDCDYDRNHNYVKVGSKVVGCIRDREVTLYKGNYRACQDILDEIAKRLNSLHIYCTGTLTNYQTVVGTVND